MAESDFGEPILNDAVYNLQYKNAFTPQERTLVQNITKFSKIHKDLSRLPDGKGYEKFSKLDSDVQAALKALYGEETNYMMEPQSFFSEAWSRLSSPLRAAMEVASDYVKLINVGQLAGLNATVNQGNFFDKDVWYNAWNNNESFYNNELDAAYTQKYGKAKAFIAKRILAGETPGKIIDAYGTMDEEFAAALQSFFNEQDKWDNGILEDYRQAKLSIGRVGANYLLGSRDGETVKAVEIPFAIFKASSMDAETRDKWFTAVSSEYDALYQIVADPLTYLTFGVETGVKFAGMAISQLARANKLARFGRVDELFKIKKVSKFWDDYGASIEKLAAARQAGNTKLSSEIVKDIQMRFPRHGTDADIEFALRNNFINSTKVRDYFIQLEDITFLLSGKTADSKYFMNSVAVARSQRSVGQTIRRAWYNFGKSKSKEDIAAIEDDVIKEIESIGKYDNTPLEETPVLNRLKEKNKTGRNFIFNMLSRHPSDESIIIGDNAEQTLDTIRNISRILVPDDIANVVAQRFLVANTDERVVMLRGLYRGVMESMGIDKAAGGRQIIDEIMDSKFGHIGMTTTTNLRAAGIDAVDTAPIATNGAIYNFQATAVIGNLNWEVLAQEAAAAALKTGGKSRSERLALISMIGGAVNSKVVSYLLGKWNLFTLAPKLGIRGAVDESFFAYMTAPGAVLRYIATGKAKSAGKSVTRFTGSKSATGIFGNGFRKIASFVLPKKSGINPVAEISKLRRDEILQQSILWAEGNKLPREAAMVHAEQLLAHESLSYSHLLDGQELNDMYDLLISTPYAIDSASSSLGRRLGTNASIEDEVRFVLEDETMLTKAQQEIGAIIGKGGTEYAIRELNNSQIKFAMFREFYKRFFVNELEGLSLPRLFLVNDGLRTVADVQKFKSQIVGYITDAKYPHRLKNFLNVRAGVYVLRQKGMTDTEIVEHYAEVISRDMYKAFHGEGFNDSLLNFFKDKWGSSNIDRIKSLTFDDYSLLVANNLRQDNIITDIENLTNMGSDIASWASRYSPDKIWEMMDRTQNALIRQPLVTAYYLHYRKMYRNIENSYRIKELEKLSANATSHQIDRVENLVSKRFAEIAIRDATNNVLKYVDNPHIRSNLSQSIRNINRFFRATEDFWRRVIRLKDTPSKTLYRLRLLHSGLNGVGATHADSEGNEYFILPMDNIIFGAIEPKLRALQGDNSGFKQPQFNNLTVQISAMNPSFQDQAGIPFFSGPVAALSVLGLQSIAGFAGDPGTKFADGLDNFLLGDLGDNLDIYKAIMPAGFDRMFKIFDNDYKSKINHSAILSAMAYNEAAGIDGIDANSSPQEVQDYLDKVRISGHNLIIIRSVLGTILPFGVGSQESIAPQRIINPETGEEVINPETGMPETQGVVTPDYLLDVGIGNIRSEYFDILDSIIAQYGSDVSDPYELAAAIFVGNNPNKLIYTVSREDKSVKPLLRKTTEVKDWILSNRSFIDKYGEAAYLFAPQSEVTNPAMYRWMELAGLTENIDIKDYLRNINIAMDKQKYFDIEDWENDRLATESTYYGRKSIIDAAAAQREAVKNSNPWLKASLTENGFDVNWETDTLRSVRDIVADKSSPISKEQRKRLTTALAIFDKGYDYVTNDTLTILPNYSYLKSNMKNKILEDLNNISQGDPFLRQVVSLVFKPLLKYNARSTPSATPLEQNISYGAING